MLCIFIFLRILCKSSELHTFQDVPLALYYLQNLSRICFNSVLEYCEVLKGFELYLVIVTIEIQEAFCLFQKSLWTR